jgi:hypothetical protein
MLVVMETTSKQSTAWMAMVGFVLMSPVLYLLALGPFCWLVYAADIDALWRSWIVIKRPVVWLRPHVPGFGALVERYLDLWF